MGANEKHAATYHGGAGAPVTEAVCERYMHDRHATDGMEPVRARTEFDRWLEAVRAEAKAEALNEAAEGIRNMTLDDNPTDWLTDFAEQYKEEPTNGR